MVSFSGNDAVMWLGPLPVGGFPISFIVVIAIYIVMHILLTKTALGRSIYRVGGNPEAARLSGINSANVLTFCHTPVRFRQPGWHRIHRSFRYLQRR